MSVVGYAQPTDSRQLEAGCSLAKWCACSRLNSEALKKLSVCPQIEPPPPTATELLAEQQAAAPTENGGAAPGAEFQPQPPGSNNPFGQNASFGAPPGSFTQVCGHARRYIKSFVPVSFCMLHEPRF